MHFRRVKKPTTGMDMGPLLDCVLQLLIFFMLSSTFMTPKVHIALPQASAIGAPSEPDTVIVTATQDGRVFVNQDPVPAAQLAARLRELVQRSPRKAVMFRGDKVVPFQTVMDVIDAARRAGAEHLDIAHTIMPGGGDGP